MAKSNDGQKNIITGTAQQTHEMVAMCCPDAIPLFNRDGIYLMPIGDGDDQRFARNFRRTWRRIGKERCRSILDYWRNPDPARMMPQIEYPVIELLDDWSGRDAAVGYCTYNGHKLMFLAFVVEAMPDDMVQVLIAHELGHVYRKAIGADIVDPANLPTETEREKEEFATQLTVAGVWGFDEEALTEWLNENCDSMMRDYKARMSG